MFPHAVFCRFKHQSQALIPLTHSVVLCLAWGKKAFSGESKPFPSGGHLEGVSIYCKQMHTTSAQRGLGHPLGSLPLSCATHSLEKANSVFLDLTCTGAHLCSLSLHCLAQRNLSDACSVQFEILLKPRSPRFSLFCIAQLGKEGLFRPNQTSPLRTTCLQWVSS